MEKISIRLIIIIICGLTACDQNKNPQSEKTKQHETKTIEKLYTERDALYASEGFVKQQLKSPLTAIFGDLKDAMVIKSNDTTFNISNHVDAENSFGVIQRQLYSCKIIFNNDSTVICHNIKIQNK